MRIKGLILYILGSMGVHVTVIIIGLPGIIYGVQTHFFDVQSLQFINNYKLQHT